MASGIDSAVQSGVIAAGGHTIAVLGCGIDQVYPPQNGKLMNQIAKTGTLLTEYAPGTAPMGRNFPIRNRIISGLSQGTVVVEANYKSGSLITSDYAVRQGRDIFAFPGSPESDCAKGTNALIRKGAKLVVCAEDILEEYELLYPNRIFMENISMRKHKAKREISESEISETISPPQAPRKKEKPVSVKKDVPTEEPKKAAESVSPPEQTKNAESCADMTGREILSVVHGEMSVDEITSALSAKLGKSLEIGELLGTLTILELDGFLIALPGGKYRLN